MRRGVQAFDVLAIVLGVVFVHQALIGRSPWTAFARAATPFRHTLEVVDGVPRSTFVCEEHDGATHAWAFDAELTRSLPGTHHTSLPFIYVLTNSSRDGSAAVTEAVLRRSFCPGGWLAARSPCGEDSRQVTAVFRDLDGRITRSVRAVCAPR